MMYAIIYLTKDQLREININSVLDHNDHFYIKDGMKFWKKDFNETVTRYTLSPHNTGKKSPIGSINQNPMRKIYTTDRLQYGNTYKTIRGVKALYDDLIKEFPEKESSIFVVECKEKWNEEINKDIELENKRHILAIQNLKSKLK